MLLVSLVELTPYNEVLNGSVLNESVLNEAVFVSVPDELMPKSSK